MSAARVELPKALHNLLKGFLTTCSHYPQLVPRLSASLPVFIDGDDWEDAAEALDDLFLGDAEIW